jgi:hypothetical protein
MRFQVEKYGKADWRVVDTFSKRDVSSRHRTEGEARRVAAMLEAK